MIKTNPSYSSWIQALLVGLFLFLQLYYYRLTRVDFGIVKADGQLIGTLMKHNVDVTKRLSFYLTSLGLGTITMLLFAYLGNRISTDKAKTQWSFLATISVIGLFQFFFSAFTDHSLLINLSLTLFIGGMIKVGLDIIKPKEIDLGQYLLLFVLSLGGSLIVKNILDSSLILNDLLTACFVGLIITEHFVDSKILNINRLCYGISSLAILSCVFNEFQFLSTLDDSSVLLPIVKILILLLVLGLAILTWRKYLFTSTKYRLTGQIFSLLLVIVFVSYYSTIVQVPSDQFELANVANSYMRVFHFKEWPFVDFISSHMLYDQLPSYLYGFIYGYEGGLEFMSFDFIYQWIIFGSIFWFLSYQFKQPIWAIVFLVCFPFIKAVFPYSPVLITTILLYKCYRSVRLRDYVLLGGYSFFLFFWKLDIGVANLMMVAMSCGVILFKSAEKNQLKNLLKALGIWGGIAGLTFLILCIAFGGSYLFTQLSLLWEYIGANTAHGLPDITYQLSRLYYLHYFILPVVILSLAIYTVRRMDFQRIDMAIVGLSIFYFANFQRGLVRHSLTSGTDAFLSSFAILIIALFAARWLAYQYRFFVFAATLTVLVPLTEFGSIQNQKALYTVLTDYFEETPVWKNKSTSSRVSSDKPLPYQDLKVFIETQFSAESSFIDLTNHPMMYYYTQRKPPSYFNQYLQNSVTETQQAINIERLKKLDLPLVIYRSENPEWLDETDGIPNQLRYAAITRYVHKHYAPYSIIDGKHIWLKKSHPLLIDAIEYHPVYEQNLGHIPGILAKQSEEELFEKLDLADLDSLALGTYPGRAEYLSWKGNQLPDGEHAVTLLKNKAMMARFIFRTEAKSYEEYLLPIDWIYPWIDRDTTDVFSIRFSDPRVKQVQILYN